QRSLELLRRTYHPAADGGGGWYHSLENETPGPSATASGIASFVVHGQRAEFWRDGRAFLQRRQIRSPEGALDGGRAVNTSSGHPVAEATALVARQLVLARVVHGPSAPDLGRARDWLLANQNKDGGWGSFRGQPSRVWLTAMAVRALSELAPYDAMLWR